MNLEQLNIPQFDDLQHPQVLKPAILNAKRSAALGFWLVVTPAFLIACLVMKYVIYWETGFMQHFKQCWAALDNDELSFWLQLLLLLFAPLAALVVNLLAVLHVEYDKAGKALNINLKLRWTNLLLAALSILILGLFTLYAIGEYYRHLL